MSGDLLRDGLELLFVIAVGGMLISALRRMRRGQISVPYCAECDSPISRAYPRCPKCGAVRT